MKAEVRALLRKAHTSLQAAELLSQQGFTDFSASRAYYAMFYAAEALLLDQGLSFSSHAAVIAAFGREIAKPGIMDRHFHRYLIDAQDLRNLGDYGLGPALAPAQVEELLNWATEFLSEAERALTP